jgi:uncharacterized damage-inducible protein DinB
MTIEQQQYPIGKWVSKESYTTEEMQQNLADLVTTAQQYSELTAHLSETDLEKTYRDGSWTIRQVVHHVADTHLWHFIRLKQAMTEENPVGVFGNVNMLATFADYAAPVADALQMIKSTHNRYASLFAGISSSDYTRSYYHPFRQINVTIPQALDMVVWHAKHHLGQIEIALR